MTLPPLQPYPIIGSDTGLQTDRKPYLLPDKGYQILDNCYIYRERLKKKEGNKILGRLTRNFTDLNYFQTAVSPWTFNIKVVTGYVSTADNANPGQVTTLYPHGLTTGDKVIITGLVATGAAPVNYNNNTFTITVNSTTTFTVGQDAAAFGTYVSGGFWISNRALTATEPNATIKEGSVIFTISAGPDIVFTDQGNGLLTSPTGGNSGNINYSTGNITLTHTAGATVNTVLTYSYSPSLPVMAENNRDIAGINDEQTIFFDTKYSYVYVEPNFQEFIPGTIWNGTDTDFFWSWNYRGVTNNIRLFFVTNFVSTALNPMRYTDGSTWTDFIPTINTTGSTDSLFSALILVSYYGRLLAFNTWEGVSGAGPAAAVNLFNRCRFSAVGSPIASTAWRQDVFGQGGFIDAPTNEEITAVGFLQNTLIVQFETTTWQLRYVGDYGFPFIFERVSSDYGSDCTFSGVLFNDRFLSIGDKAIIQSNDVSVGRIDDKIPDVIYSFKSTAAGLERVHGIRDYQRELVFWSYVENDSQLTYPNKVLVYNYRNNTFSQFRDNTTCFGTLNRQSNVTWDSTSVFWDDDDISWDDVDDNINFPTIIIGNQQGFVHEYGTTSTILPSSTANNTISPQASLFIQSIDISGFPLGPIILTVPNHNLSQNEILYISGLNFVDTSTNAIIPTDLNKKFYKLLEVLDANTFTITKWNGLTYIDNFDYIPLSGTGTYMGGGTVALIPKLRAKTKDFNPYLNKGIQPKCSYIDFLTSCTNNAAMTVFVYINTSLSVRGNLLVGNINTPTTTAAPFYITDSNITWHRFVSTFTGQFFNIEMTYNDELMNDLNTQQSLLEVHALTMWVREGSRNVF